MPYLVRAINRENWPEPDENVQVCELDADALNDLKTTENKLSTWYAEDEKDIDDAILAYLGSMDKWVKQEEKEFIFIDTKDIIINNIKIIDEPNDTYIKDHEELHRDLACLQLMDIENLCGEFIQVLNCGNLVVKTKQEIRELFKKAVKSDLICSETIDKTKHGTLRKYVKDIEREIATETMMKT